MNSPFVVPEALRNELAAPERPARLHGADLLPDLDLSSVEQQFFVEWEVPEPHDARRGTVPAR